jgi:hypothetical protein
MESSDTLWSLAEKYKLSIPDNLNKMSKNTEIISCFEHSCEYGVFPYIEKCERNDYKYWFPIYFDMELTGCAFVYLINLHPFVGSDDRPKYACRRIYEGDKGRIFYKQIKTKRNLPEHEIPRPEDLKPIGNFKQKGKHLYKNL